MNKSFIHIAFVLLFLSTVAIGQVKPLSLHYIDRIDNAEIYFSYANYHFLDEKDSAKRAFELQTHTAVLPLIPNTTNIGFGDSKLSLEVNKKQGEQTKSAFRLYPIADLTVGGEIGPKSKFLYTGGIGMGMDLSFKKFYLTTKFLPYLNSAPYVSDSLQQNLNLDAGTNRSIIRNLFYRGEFIAAYRPNQFFTFLGGFGKNFFGEGYRSLLLSDNGPANPFVKLETTFGPVKYVNLYQMWFDNTTDPFDTGFDKNKFSSTHYLSWNVTRNFNVGIFESVVWQSGDTLLNRGFDINYINPIVFYRPVEYSTGSADNVLLGLNTNVKILHKHNIYFQLILDEFLLAELRANSKWWGNKFGAQFGYKATDFIVPGLYFQTEFNAVRPFTYSHKQSTEAYGNMNMSITHPLGANYFEVLNILSYKKNKMRFTLKSTWSHFGIDTSAINNGQNIFLPYNTRDGDYDHKMMQGVRTNVFNENFVFQYPLFEKIDLYLHATYNYRLMWQRERTTHHHYLMIGLRSRLWNRYTDY